MEFQNIETCLACGKESLTEWLNLGRLPLANTFLSEPIKLPTYPLVINQCTSCTHCQLSCAVSPTLLYSDYKYVSGTTSTLRSHFKDLVSEVSNREDKTVLDIGCNDGTLLEEFKKVGFDVFGVDPAENIREITSSKGIPVLVDFWNSYLAEYMDVKFSVITALNCLAHNSNPLDFMKGCYTALKDDGTVVVEFPLLSYTLNTTDIGQFYAEHNSYFTVKSFKTLVSRSGFYISHRKVFPNIHGGTVRFILKKGSPEWDSTHNWIFDHDLQESMISFKTNLKSNLQSLSELILNVSRKATIVAYGASAKSSTLFNLPEMSDAVRHIGSVVDDSKLKQGLFCPGSGLEILKPEDLIGHDNLVVLITAHNFKEEIVEKLKKLGVKRIINYVPEVSMESI